MNKYKKKDTQIEKIIVGQTEKIIQNKKLLQNIETHYFNHNKNHTHFWFPSVRAQ